MPPSADTIQRPAVTVSPEASSSVGPSAPMKAIRVSSGDQAAADVSNVPGPVRGPVVEEPDRAPVAAPGKLPRVLEIGLFEVDTLEVAAVGPDAVADVRLVVLRLTRRRALVADDEDPVARRGPRRRRRILQDELRLRAVGPDRVDAGDAGLLDALDREQAPVRRPGRGDHVGGVRHLVRRRVVGIDEVDRVRAADGDEALARGRHGRSSCGGSGAGSRRQGGCGRRLRARRRDVGRRGRLLFCRRRRRGLLIRHRRRRGDGLGGTTPARRSRSTRPRRACAPSCHSVTSPRAATAKSSPPHECEVVRRARRALAHRDECDLIAFGRPGR